MVIPAAPLSVHKKLIRWKWAVLGWQGVLGVLLCPFIQCADWPVQAGMPVLTGKLLAHAYCKARNAEQSTTEEAKTVILLSAGAQTFKQPLVIQISRLGPTKHLTQNLWGIK